MRYKSVKDVIDLLEANGFIIKGQISAPVF